MPNLLPFFCYYTKPEKGFRLYPDATKIGDVSRFERIAAKIDNVLRKHDGEILSPMIYLTYELNDTSPHAFEDYLDSIASTIHQLLIDESPQQFSDEKNRFFIDVSFTDEQSLENTTNALLNDPDTPTYRAFSSEEQTLDISGPILVRPEDSETVSQLVYLLHLKLETFADPQMTLARLDEIGEFRNTLRLSFIQRFQSILNGLDGQKFDSPDFSRELVKKINAERAALGVGFAYKPTNDSVYLRCNAQKGKYTVFGLTASSDRRGIYAKAAFPPLNIVIQSIP